MRFETEQDVVSRARLLFDLRCRIMDAQDSEWIGTGSAPANQSMVDASAVAFNMHCRLRETPEGAQYARAIDEYFGIIHGRPERRGIEE